MSDSHHLGFTRSFLEACTDLKLIDLLQDLLRERPEDHCDLHAVSEELEKRRKKAQEGPMSDHPADAPALFPLDEGGATPSGPVGGELLSGPQRGFP